MAANQTGGEQGMFCRYCGKKNDADSLFCINCGKPLADSPALQKKPAPPSAPTKKTSAPVDAFGAQGQSERSQPDEAPTDMPAPIAPTDAFSTEPLPTQNESAPVDAFAAQGQSERSQPEQAPDAPSATREEDVASKESRSFESIGQTMGKKVDELTRSGNVKVKQFAETIDDKKTVELSYPVYLISAVVAIFAPFFPYLKFSAFGLSLNTNFVRIPAEIAGIAGDKVQWGDGIFLILIAAVAMVAWKLKNKVAMLCVGSGAAVFSVIAIRQAQQAKNLIAGTVAENVVQMGIGYYLCILSSIALFAFSFMYYYKTKEPTDEKTE